MAKSIKVENISKAYQLGNFSTGTISRDLERLWARTFGKDDPFLKIGEANKNEPKGKNDVFWSLKDISFELEQGDAVGIVGRNGAGKSTLLKILSRITSPTSGTIKIKGRITSLLEVGTGFHPELSGRENIYLNGAILGMRKTEITRKFDEIVNFAGVDRYIDTPVKRYSSGMYVRLAFAVAAHLESEILIVDEVLAVGDAEFQKKCLGKIGDISKGEGKTVLFVSHDMNSIQTLCSKSLYLKDGKLINYDYSNKIIHQYLSTRVSVQKRTGTGGISVLNLKITNEYNEEVKQLISNQKYTIEVIIKSVVQKSNINFLLGFNNLNKVRACSLWTNFHNLTYTLENGTYNLKFEIPNFRLTPGLYELNTYIEQGGEVIERIDDYQDIMVYSETNSVKIVEPTISTGSYVEDFKCSLNLMNG